MYCGGAPRAQAAMEDLTLTCPDCRGDMTKETVGEMTIDVCASCMGTWYDAQELEVHLSHPPAEDGPAEATEEEAAHEFWAMLPQTAKDARPEKTEDGPIKYRSCPRCRQQMGRKNYQSTGIVLDVCVRHGMYLDAGELSAIRQALDARNADAASMGELKPEYQQRAQEALKDGRPKQ